MSRRFGVGYAYGTIDVLLEAVRTTDQFGDDLNTVAPTPDGQRGLIPAYTVWNTAVNYTIARSTLFLTVKNLFDDLFIVDRTRGILPGSPRLVQAGVRLAILTGGHDMKRLTLFAAAVAVALLAPDGRSWTVRTPG